MVQFNYPDVPIITETFQNIVFLSSFYITIFSSYIGVLQSSAELKRNVASDV